MTGNEATNTTAPGVQAQVPGYGQTLWTPDEETVKRSQTARYMSWLAERGINATTYDELWRWSTDHIADFWDSVWEYFGVLGDRGDGPVLAGGPMPDVRWFQGATLNYARNMLRTAQADPDRPAIIAFGERETAGRTMTYGQLQAEVARVAKGLRALGVERGDRVAGLVPNIPQAVIALLATASIGAVW